MFLTILAGLLALCGCARPRPLRLHLAEHVERPERSVVIFFVDGLDRSRFHDLLERGLLPNIEKRFVRGGVGVEHAVTTLPPITYAVTVSLLTGRFPGHHGILGTRWFDPDTLEYRDYVGATTFRTVNDHFQQPTIYEILADHLTVSNQCHTRRGATRVVDSSTRSGIDWFFGNYIGVDRRVGTLMGRVARVANEAGRWPTLLLNYFPGVDEIGHRFGSDSTRYRAALLNADTQVGRIIAALEDAGLARHTYFVLFTDHGHVPLGGDRIVRLVGWLRGQCRLRVYQGRIDTDDYAKRQRLLERFDAVLVSGAPRRVAIHLRGPNGWQEPPAPQALERVLGLPGLDGDRRQALHELPGVALVCVPDDTNRVRVVSKDGTAIIDRQTRGGAKSYRLVLPANAEGEPDPSLDPLGYATDSRLRRFIAQGWHTSREWLAATADTRYPDFVPQVVEMFDSPRAGDIVAFAADGWAFDSREAGGHGSALDADMLVPMYFAGPRLPRGTIIATARTVDILPTVLDFLGERERLAGVRPIDGVSLLPQLEAAGEHEP